MSRACSGSEDGSHGSSATRHPQPGTHVPRSSEAPIDRISSVLESSPDLQSALELFPSESTEVSSLAPASGRDFPEPAVFTIVADSANNQSLVGEDRSRRRRPRSREVVGSLRIGRRGLAMLNGTRRTIFTMERRVARLVTMILEIAGGAGRRAQALIVAAKQSDQPGRLRRGAIGLLSRLACERRRTARWGLMALSQHVRILESRRVGLRRLAVWRHSVVRQYGRVADVRRASRRTAVVTVVAASLVALAAAGTLVRQLRPADESSGLMPFDQSGASTPSGGVVDGAALTSQSVAAAGGPLALEFAISENRPVKVPSEDAVDGASAVAAGMGGDTARGSAASSVPEAKPAETRRAIQRVLNRYRDAFSVLDVRAVQAVWPSVDAQAVATAFRGLEEQNLEYGSCRITVAADDTRASAMCGGEATYSRAGTRALRTEPRRWQFALHKVNDRWLIDDVTSR